VRCLVSKQLLFVRWPVQITDRRTLFDHDSAARYGVEEVVGGFRTGAAGEAFGSPFFTEPAGGEGWVLKTTSHSPPNDAGNGLERPPCVIHGIGVPGLTVLPGSCEPGFGLLGSEAPERELVETVGDFGTRVVLPAEWQLMAIAVPGGIWILVRAGNG
jgi:hypothetical protein